MDVERHERLLFATVMGPYWHTLRPPACMERGEGDLSPAHRGTDEYRTSLVLCLPGGFGPTSLDTVWVLIPGWSGMCLSEVPAFK